MLFHFFNGDRLINVANTTRIEIFPLALGKASVMQSTERTGDMSSMAVKFIREFLRGTMRMFEEREIRTGFDVLEAEYRPNDLL